MREATDKSTKAYKVIDELLKGKEKQLSKGLHFFDKDGHKRTECRVKWWTGTERRETYKDIYLGCSDELADKPLNLLKEFTNILKTNRSFSVTTGLKENQC